MVRIQKSRFGKKDEEILSVLASIARLIKKDYLFRFIGRFRRAPKNALHLNNLKTVQSKAKAWGLEGLVNKCEKILKKK